MFRDLGVVVVEEEEEEEETVVSIHLLIQVELGHLSRYLLLEQQLLRLNIESYLPSLQRQLLSHLPTAAEVEPPILLQQHLSLLLSLQQLNKPLHVVIK